MTTFVLVPGAGVDGWMWHRVVPLLKPAGEVVRVDPPWADPAAHLADHVRVVVEACAGPDDLYDLDDVVVVGQSMGAYAASLAAAEVAARHLVLLNAMVPAPGESAGAWWDAVGQEEARRESEVAAGRDGSADFDLREGFFHDVPDEVTTAAFEHGEVGLADTIFGDPWPLPAWPHVPTTVVVGADDRFFPLALQQRVARERLGLEPVVVPGGHLAALSFPEEVARAILDAASLG